MAEAPRFVVWLDRDGTLVDDPGYLDDPDALVLFEGVAGALRRLRRAGALLVLITNQSGIARGYMTRETVDRIHERMQAELGEARVDHIELCPHWPAEQLPEGELACECRKPLPGMVLRARAALKLEAGKQPEFLIGDKRSDLELARGIGATAVLVRTGDGSQAESELGSGLRPDFVADDLEAATEWILDRLESPAEA